MTDLAILPVCYCTDHDGAHVHAPTVKDVTSVLGSMFSPIRGERGPAIVVDEPPPRTPKGDGKPPPEGMAPPISSQVLRDCKDLGCRPDKDEHIVCPRVNARLNLLAAALASEQRAWDRQHAEIARLRNAREEEHAAAANLARALRAFGKERQFKGQLCFCDTIDKSYCVGQPRCENARRALAALGFHA